MLVSLAVLAQEREAFGSHVWNRSPFLSPYLYTSIYLVVIYRVSPAYLVFLLVDTDNSADLTFLHTGCARNGIRCEG